jgi:putative RNA 2'-phosphotransferase
MNPLLTRASTFLSYLLRHQPDAIGLSLDSEGWAVIDDLVRLSRASAHPLSRALIEAVVRTHNKPRFRLSNDGLRPNRARTLWVFVTFGETEAEFGGTAVL